MSYKNYNIGQTFFISVTLKIDIESHFFILVSHYNSYRIFNVKLFFLSRFTFAKLFFSFSLRFASIPSCSFHAWLPFHIILCVSISSLKFVGVVIGCCHFCHCDDHWLLSFFAILVVIGCCLFFSLRWLLKL